MKDAIRCCVFDIGLVCVESPQIAPSQQPIESNFSHRASCKSIILSTGENNIPLFALARACDSVPSAQPGKNGSNFHIGYGYQMVTFDMHQCQT